MMGFWWSTDSPLNATPEQGGTGGTQPMPIFTSPYVMRWRSSFEGMVGVTNFSIPLTLLSAVLEEGVDFPFYTRGPLYPSPVRRKKRLNPGVDMAVPFTILEGVGVDTSLLFFPEVAETPLKALSRKVMKARWMALMAGSRPFLFPRIPATTYSDTLCRVLREIQEHLLEPFPGSVDWQIWSVEEVEAAFNRRLNKFLEDSGIIRERRLMESPGGVALLHLPSDCLSVRRVSWVTGALGQGAYATLTRIDEAQLEGVVGWEDAVGEPFAYVGEPRTIRLYPTPPGVGVVELVIVPALGTLSGCDPIPIPACFVPFVKWGVIADLLRKEGEANDPERSKYAEGRWQEGIELARLLLGTEV